jgi:pimeloyl-ACP methyl ester carboxylesterase
MQRTLSLTLLALAASGSYLDAQRCPERATQHIRPSLRHAPLDLEGTYRAPFEFVCGAPAVIRVRRSGAELVATVQAGADCPQAGRTRWRGLQPVPGQASFPVRIARPGGGTAEGTARLADRCSIEVGPQNGRASAYYRTDPACAPQPRPLVVFIGGFADGLNRNVVRVFCAYDARWEQTRKLYFAYDGNRGAMARAIQDSADGAPVVLVGHSYGGDTAYDLADSLGSRVHLLVTLDPVSPRRERQTVPRPGEVRRWINVRVGSAPGLSSCGLAGVVGGAWGPQPAADADLRFPPDPAKDDPDDDHCKTEEMFLLEPVQAALAAVG